jgi:hypothetical protein
VAIALTALALDHRRGDPQSPTLPLRFYDQRCVLIPEWGIGAAADVPVAFIRNRLTPAISILARFAATPDEPMMVEARAFVRRDSDGSALLADLPAMQVPLVGGDSGWCSFAMPTAVLVASGVAVARCVWRWQIRRGPAARWQDLVETALRVYVVLGPPTAPWQSLSGSGDDACVPWVPVLDVACAWASGAVDVGEAARRITRAVFALGDNRLRYDALVGAPHYTVLGVPRFLLAAFLDRLAGGEGAGPLVNCSDCATIVSTFANLLGADLWQSKMGLVAPQFRLNPIRAIGSHTWSRVWGGFSFHEVAWSGACGEQDRVFDACLEVDVDPNPMASPHKPLLPVDALFGTAGSGDYRDRLTAPEDRVLCAPQPTLRARRTVAAQVLAWSPPSPEAQHIEDDDATTVFIDGFAFFGQELPDWRLSRQEVVAVLLPAFRAASEGPGRVIASWWHAAMPAPPTVRIESFEMPSFSAAKSLLTSLRTEFERPLLDTSSDTSVGDASIATADGALVMFRRGNHVHVVRPAGPQPIDAPAVAQTLDDWLTSAGDAGPARSLFATQRLPGIASASYWRRLLLHGTAVRRDATGVRLDPMPGAIATIQQQLISPASRLGTRRLNLG